MANGKIQLKVSEEDSDVAYVSLPAHPGEGTYGIVAKQISLRDLLPDYDGPDIFFDIGSSNEILGIEIVG